MVVAHRDGEPAVVGPDHVQVASAGRAADVEPRSLAGVLGQVVSGPLSLGGGLLLYLRGGLRSGGGWGFI